MEFARSAGHIARVFLCDSAQSISAGKPNTIRLQATIEVSLVALQAMLYRLESGTPYVFVEALTIQPAAAAAGRPPEDPLLRATLSVRAFWRRSGS